MTQQTAIATREASGLETPKPAAPTESEFYVLKETATMLIKSGFLPGAIKTAEQAIAIILTGRELGIGTMAALNTINVIQGKPTVSPQLMLALIERSGQLADIQIEPHDNGAVRCTMLRRGRSPHTEIFGDDEAKAMQLSDKDNYKKQKATMYRWRAVAACARVVFPDVITGLYTPDEMGADINADGELLPPAEPRPATKKELTEVAVDLGAQIIAVCHDLNEAKDSIEWKAATFGDYVQQLFDDENVKSADDLTDEQKTFLLEDLQERLRLLKDNA